MKNVGSTSVGTISTKAGRTVSKIGWSKQEDSKEKQWEIKKKKKSEKVE